MPEEAAGTKESSPRPGKRRFRRGLFGYRRSQVEAAVRELEVQNLELRQELLERSSEMDEIAADLAKARAELRYHADREAFVETEVERARAQAERVEREAHARAAEVERDAKDRAVQLVERVCGEANTILQQAREDAREVGARVHDDTRHAATRVDQLRQIQLNIHRTLRSAFDTFEEGMRTLESAAPSHSAMIVHPSQAATNGTPRRRTLTSGDGAGKDAEMDFGRGRALEMATQLGDLPQVVPGLEREPAEERPAPVTVASRD